MVTATVMSKLALKATDAEKHPVPAMVTGSVALIQMAMVGQTKETDSHKTHPNGEMRMAMDLVTIQRATRLMNVRMNL
tara:strand:+ start:235 stop:468 length:234 start_codon:yes stop_codon:yes gene_type:complete